MSKTLYQNAFDTAERLKQQAYQMGLSGKPLPEKPAEPPPSDLHEWVWSFRFVREAHRRGMDALKAAQS